MISVNKKIVEKLIKDNRFNKSKLADLLNIDRKALYGWFDHLTDDRIIKILKVVDINNAKTDSCVLNILFSHFSFAPKCISQYPNYFSRLYIIKLYLTHPMKI